MNEFAFKYKYNCKYCSTKSSLQNLHANLYIFFMNELAFEYEYNCKYCSAKLNLSIVTSNLLELTHQLAHNQQSSTFPINSSTYVNNKKKFFLFNPGK